MEASFVTAPAAPLPHPVGRPLQLRSDDQLVALFRMGYDEAFDVIDERYRGRLLAYARQMLGPSGHDAEDVLQDVLVSAFRALRADDRPVTLRAWLYRVAHNRCIDVLRRGTGASAIRVGRLGDAGEEAADRVASLHAFGADPHADLERRDALRALVTDISRLPGQQRSALLMRELEGLTYHELADALQVTIPSVKSLLVRARLGLVEAQDARDTACDAIREDLDGAHRRGVRASARARRHLRECRDCTSYRSHLKASRTRRAIDGPLGLALKLIGFGSVAGGTAAAGGGAAAVGTTALAAKVATAVCCAALVGGGAAEIAERSVHRAPASSATTAPAEPVSGAAAAVATRLGATAPIAAAVPGAPAATPGPTTTSRRAARSRPAPRVTALVPVPLLLPGTALPPLGPAHEPTATPSEVPVLAPAASVELPLTALPPASGPPPVLTPTPGTEPTGSAPAGPATPPVTTPPAGTSPPSTGATDPAPSPTPTEAGTGVTPTPTPSPAGEPSGDKPKGAVTQPAETSAPGTSTPAEQGADRQPKPGRATDTAPPRTSTGSAQGERRTSRKPARRAGKAPRSGQQGTTATTSQAAPSSGGGQPQSSGTASTASAGDASPDA